jgi:hypothetical protein
VGGEAPVTPVLSIDSSYLNLFYKPCDNKDQNQGLTINSLVVHAVIDNTFDEAQKLEVVA